MIVIPMAGLSRRFSQAGYTLPKYQLPVPGGTLFGRTVRSFEAQFDTDLFVFAYRDVSDTREFLERECQHLGIRYFRLQEIRQETEGQAHTVDLALSGLPAEDGDRVVIFNIDTIRDGWRAPKFPDGETPDGYLEVVRAEGDSWSFVDPGPGQTVRRTTEKERVSELCSTGLYEFRSPEMFRMAFEEARARDQRVKGEYYVAPLYNILIQNGLDIRYYEINPSDVTFSGVPAEYEALVAQDATRDPRER